MKEKCSKCLEWKERSEFTKLQMGSKPRCIACVEKKAQVEELKSEIERVSAKLAMMKLELKKLNGTYIPKEPQSEEKVVHEVKRVETALRMHSRLPLGMKKGKDDVYYFSNGAVKKKKVWSGPYGKYTSYKNEKTGKWVYIGLEKLRKQIFGNDSKLGV